MAIVTDPDNLDRDQVIYNTESQTISLYEVGALIDPGTTGSDGNHVADRTFESLGSTFQTDGVAAGDILCIFTGPNAGHYEIATIPSETTVTIRTEYDVFTDLTGVTAYEDLLEFDIREPTGGTIVDGVTIQAVYSFSKEEWRVDSLQAGSDDLIRHEFPYEAITSEQFEVGGGQAHYDWAWHAPSSTTLYQEYTRKLVRTGGWATKDNANATSDQWTGIVTLGALDADTQVYYQQVDASADPTDFKFQGAVNEAIVIFEDLSAVSAAIADDGGALTDETTGANEATADDMTLVPSTGAAEDAYYIGALRKFNSVNINVSTASAGTYTITWEFYNGNTAAWEALADISDGTTGFTTSGANDVTWTVPGDWGTTSVNAQGPFYYVRARVSAYTSGGNALGQQAILGDADYTTYLKLFARKKGKTYAQSEIADIGVTTIGTIVNRFPLAHADDAAIVATDAEILGTSLFRNATEVTSNINGTDGDPTESGTLFTSSGSLFQTAGIAAGDTLRITDAGSTQQGYYTIASVPSETTLNIAPDFEVSTFQAGAESALDFEIYTTYVVSDTSSQTHASYTTAGASNGIIESGTPGVGFITDTTGATFGSVAVGDVLEITSSVGNNGLYTVLDATTTGASNPTSTVIYVDTSDQAFPGSLEGSVDYKVREPGIYLQYKREAIALTSTGNLTFADANPDTIVRASGDWGTDGVTAGSIITITGSASNDGSYTVASVSTVTATLVATDTLVAEGPVAATATAYDPFKRTINGVVYGFSWRVFGNTAGLSDVYQYIQHQLRQTTDIDAADEYFRGDVTDLLMAFSTPTGTMFDAIIDNIANADINNATYRDATGTDRTFPFVAAGSISFNSNLQTDANAKYTMFFTNDDAGDNTGRDFSTPTAIIVQDDTATDITGDVSAQSSVAFTFDYDGNIQRGAASAGVDAPVTIVAIGLATAQYVITTGTITQSKANNFSLVAALERNYST